MSAAAELIQGSDEWRRARCGSVGASQIHMLVARTKNGWGASRANLMAQVIAERLTAVPQESYTNSAMQWGVDHEDEARSAYEAHSGNLVERVGLVLHPRLLHTHASPDGLVGADGLLEIKCMQTAGHLDTLLTESFDGKYLLQAQWQMACTGRQWCDLTAYDPRLPERMRLFIKRIHRDADQIAELEGHVEQFLREIGERLLTLQTKYP